MVRHLAPILAALTLAFGGCAYDGLDGPSEPDLVGPRAASRGGSAEPVTTGAAAPAGTRVAGYLWQPTIVAEAETDAPYLLDSGDRLRIFVYGQPNLSRLYTVDHDGRIAVPLIGPVKARGLSTDGLEHLIRARLGSRFVRDPQVTVDVYQNRPFFILGEVRNAGQFPYVSGITVETAVAIAGGYSERANERRARLTRRVGGVVEVTDVSPEQVLQPGDTVYIYERYF